MLHWSMYGNPGTLDHPEAAERQVYHYELTAYGTDIWLKYPSYREGFIRDALDKASARQHPSDIELMAHDGRILWTGKTKKVADAP